ncbi:MAG: DUF4912 domain-containing protein [Candidatus Omnitrophica bacterium]|nr:DUF4912 domain-containing protein [Candidatus Omnitrophota bacterium]
MNSKQTDSPNSSSFLSELAQLTKSALYRIAQTLRIPKRSVMNKSELVEALSQKQGETEMALKNLQENGSSKNVDALKSIPSASSASDRPAPSKTEAPVRPSPGQIPPVKEKTAAPEEAASSSIAPAPKEEIREPETIWAGEEGPDLPSGYGMSVLRALPRDPHWAFLYWEISQDTRDQIQQEEGEWFFDIAVPLIRILNKQGDVVNEVPVLLDANSWYINLTPNGTFQFELGLKDPEGKFRSILRSNLLTLPPVEPSSQTDEEWALLSEEFQEMILHSADVDMKTLAGSGFPSMIPHILRQRKRVPWIWTSQQQPSSHLWVSSHSWPSSHAMPSSRTVTKKP